MTSSSRKRVKTIRHKRKDKEPNKFLSTTHERHFLVMHDRILLMERKVGLIPTLAPQFGRELARRGWENLASYPALANAAVVREFYTNAMVFGTETLQYLSYVRGKRIPYDVDTINRFLGIEWAGEQCQFKLAVEEGPNFDDVERVLCLPGGHFQRNRGLNIDIGQVIAMEIQDCAHSANNKSPLGHPSLITHLCEITRVNVSTPPLERPRKEIDDSYYTQYCALDEAGQPLPPPQPPRAHRRTPQPTQEPAHEDAPFQMRDMYMSLMEERMNALYRGALFRSAERNYDKSHHACLPFEMTLSATSDPHTAERHK
ncbi:hypothetical protein LR48_Vigan07g149400 [Vigna angularis]|uniref:Putative plant transposon protein domain-containing protein n=1 Tax=Phaseolus angularis TaxID=3914 RepID=A0A0L9UY42_PHAAN|nr:hypothetical protein LR48_Vigan07g149400 [Vigna angularis]